jgi:glycerophosphoryl diester phosphodiesterase
MAPTRYVAHRGGAALWPENSLLAFKNAIAAGARLLEMDVHQAADGTVVVIHDPTLDRTTNGTGPVAAHTSAELRALRLRDTSGALTQEWVPTLAEVLALAAPVGVALLVEIKTPGPAVQYVPSEDGVRVTPGPRYEGLEQRILGELAAAGVSERSMLMAFNPAVVAEVRARAPRQGTVLLVDRHHVEKARVRPVEAVRWAVTAGVTYLGLHHTLCDTAVVEAAHTAGIGIGVFTVNDEADMRRLAGLGVDVIITDRADIIARPPGGA